MKPLPLLLCAALLVPVAGLHAQPFSRADTLRGLLTPPRTAYDVTFYHLDVRIDPSERTISGSNRIAFDVVHEADMLQVDLARELEIERIEDGAGRSLPFTREHAAVFVRFPEPLRAGTSAEMTVFYGGHPRIAPNPPWDGGISFREDETGAPWVVVTCQGTGASVWWPNKDHQSDEPDSMMISITVPPGLQNISNGRLRATETLDDGWTRTDWFVANPINNYNVTMNIGRYAHFADTFASEGGRTLTLDYYVMPYNLERARRQFRQVKPMMACFEKHFGAYPFVEDGYKLVESPHPGMEHQSAVAYGNYFKNGYRMRASSRVGLEFDFIIVHETAHEWFGNSLTAEDIADMWIHESFGAYLEAVYVECRFGREQADDYMRGKRQDVRFDRPVQGTYGVHRRGSGDMYPKGALMLHTLRQVVGDDAWWPLLRAFAETYRKSILTYDDVVAFFSRESGRDLSRVMAQYLQHVDLPELVARIERQGDETRLFFRWNADVEGFDMPVRVTLDDDVFTTIYPTTEEQELPLRLSDPRRFRVDDRFYVDVRRSIVYLVPD